jgi:hypothetical protein
MKILKFLIAIFLLALVAATAVNEEEQTPSFLQTSETNTLANEAAVARSDDGKNDF